MELKEAIKVYDNVLPWNFIRNFLRYINLNKFNEARVGHGEVNFNIRKTYTLHLSNLDNSLSQVHWHNLLYGYFFNFLKRYTKELNIEGYVFEKITEIAVLKYEQGGFYTWHTDHYNKHPRTLSCILLLNNDYEGGNLSFRDLNKSNEWQVETKPNRLIVWPSSFLYPHSVKPVIKGTRYSVVAWAV